MVRPRLADPGAARAVVPRPPAGRHGGAFRFTATGRDDVQHVTRTGEGRVERLLVTVASDTVEEHMVQRRATRAEVR